MSGMAFGLLTVMRFYITWSENQLAKITHRELKYGMSFCGKGITRYSKRFKWLLKPQAILKLHWASKWYNTITMYDVADEQPMDLTNPQSCNGHDMLFRKMK